MTTLPPNRILFTSERLYRAFLVVYPRKFRRDYGWEMAQTFRDCCREALTSGGPGGLTRLWGLILYDLLITASTEHIKTWITLLKRLFGTEREYTMMDHLLNLNVALLTDVGLKRPNNEDNMTSVIPQDPQVIGKKGALFVVADGMGGHSKGEVASKMAVEGIRDAYYQNKSEDVAAALAQAVEQANRSIYQQKGEGDNNMGTTCIVAVVQGETAYIANVGDSRAYIVHEGTIKQISQDHSWVAEQIRAGALTPEEALSHPQRNVILRCLGTKEDVEVDVFTQQVQRGDALLLCTDGLSGLVADDEIVSIVEQYQPEECVAQLIARANENGGPDNITALVARIG